MWTPMKPSTQRRVLQPATNPEPLRTTDPDFPSISPTSKPHNSGDQRPGHSVDRVLRVEEPLAAGVLQTGLGCRRNPESVSGGGRECRRRGFRMGAAVAAAYRYNVPAPIQLPAVHLEIVLP